jgi:hypothetical protein
LLPLHHEMDGVNDRNDAFRERRWQSEELQRTLLSASCQDVSDGRMPGPYTLLHPETGLSAQDIETICAAARRNEASAADVR